MSETRTQSSDWLPISSAPKDGNSILLSCDGMTGLGWWATDRFVTSGRGEWRSYSFEDQDTWASCEPIAWMPAPVPLPWGSSVPDAATAPRQDDTCPVCGGDCGAANPPVFNCPMRVTCPECNGTGEIQTACTVFGPHTGPYGDPSPDGHPCDECGGSDTVTAGPSTHSALRQDKALREAAYRYLKTMTSGSAYDYEREEAEDYLRAVLARVKP